jgi:hypothetical protein
MYTPRAPTPKTSTAGFANNGSVESSGGLYPAVLMGWLVNLASSACSAE